MKKIISTGLILCSLGLSTYAQDDNLSFGGTAGFGHAWLSNSENSTYQPAANIGLTLIYSTQTNWGFGADLKYSIEGGKWKDGSITSTTRLDYVRIPLKAMYFFGERGSALRPKVSLGPSVGFLVGGKNELKTSTGNNTTTVETKAKDFAKSIDIGLAASAGVNYRLVDRTWLHLDLNYYHGFADVMENPNIEMRNRNIGISAGITVGIGKIATTN